MIETFALGWFTAVTIVALCHEPDPYLAPMCALRSPPYGDTVGCHWEHPDRHRTSYANGAVHLCNSRCIHQPPEER